MNYNLIYINIAILNFFLSDFWYFITLNSCPTKLLTGFLLVIFDFSNKI